MPTLLKSLSKLGNAIRAQKGVLVERGNPLEGNLRNVPWKRDVSPRKDVVAEERVARWKFRVSQKMGRSVV